MNETQAAISLTEKLLQRASELDPVELRHLIIGAFPGLSGGEAHLAGMTIAKQQVYAGRRQAHTRQWFQSEAAQAGLALAACEAAREAAHDGQMLP